MGSNPSLPEAFLHLVSPANALLPNKACVWSSATRRLYVRFYYASVVYNQIPHLDNPEWYVRRNLMSVKCVAITMLFLA